MRPLQLIVFLVVALASPAAAQTLVADSFDSNISAFAPPPEIGATIAWDSAGFPRGSLRLSTPPGTGPYSWARSDCFERDPSKYYTVQADIFRESLGGNCFPAFVAYDQLRCTGQVVSLSLPHGPIGLPRTWTHRQAGGIPPTWPGVSLELGLAVNGEMDCLFDNVLLLATAGPVPSALEIPTAGRAGLGILALALAGLATAALRRG